MLRPYQPSDLNQVMELWLNTNLSAHTFIDPAYWCNNYASVKLMLPQAQIFVYEDFQQIQGFIGITDNYIAGLFVTEELQSTGIGRQLLDYVKQRYNTLSLHVYKKNQRALQFYQRESFRIIEEQSDENTGELEYKMEWII